MKWALIWYDAFSEEHDTEVFNSKPKAKKRLQELKIEHTGYVLEWELRKAIKVWG